MGNFKHFCLYERQRIEKYLRNKKSLRFIADKLERSKSSIYDEIKQNSVNGIYDAKKAHHKAYVKRKYSKVQSMKVVGDIELRDFVETNIKDDQSPEGISGRLKNIEKHISYASTKAIYKFVYSVYGRQIEKHLYHKAVKKKGGKKRGTPITIDGRIMIDERPKKVSRRIEFGHYKGDFIESGKDGKGSLLVLAERKTRYPFFKYLDNRDNDTVNRAIAELLNDLPIKSLTIDNDISFQKHEELSEILQAAIYFCHPQSPNEKGTIENRNKAARRYIVKRSDLSKYDNEYFRMVETKLRTRFMKCLNYKTPKEVFELELKKQQKTLQLSSANWTKNVETINIKSS
ncbi:MAG: IS30 family transposase [Patescibacteria group bacterium]